MTRLRVGTALFGVMLLAALSAPLLSPRDPLRPDYTARYAAPAIERPLGTDGLGRDVLSRSLFGGRVSLAVALTSTAIALTFGSLLGLVASGGGRLLDTVLTRVFDAVLAFPGFLLVLLAVALLGGGVLQTILALGFAGSPLYFRLARAYSRTGLRSDYALAATALGASRPRLLLRHVAPNYVGPLFVQAASTAAGFLLVEASLSYLGLGVPLPTPSWGNVLQDARAYLSRQPWAAVGPGALLALTALSLQLISDGLRDRLHPQSR